jgi:hypothetical protein
MQDAIFITNTVKLNSHHSTSITSSEYVAIKQFKSHSFYEVPVHVIKECVRIFSNRLKCNECQNFQKDVAESNQGLLQCN